MLLIYGIVAFANAQNADIITSGTGPVISVVQTEDEALAGEFIDVLCESTGMCVTIDTNYFITRRNHNMEADQITLAEPSCSKNRTIFGTSLTICATDYGDPNCNKVFSLNATHSSYNLKLTTPNVTLTNTGDDGVTNVTILQYEIPFQCTYPLDYLLTLANMNREEYGFYIPKIYTPKLITLLLPEGEGVGEFPVVMLLYNDQYQDVYQESPTLDVGGTLFVRIVLSENPGDSVVQARECWATPTSDIEQNRFDLITDYCASPVENGQDAEVSILNNGDGTDVRWTSKVFKFDGMENNRVYLHCRARICFNNVDGTTCDKLDTCANRKRRALDGYGYSNREAFSDEVEVTTGPIFITQDGMKLTVTGEQEEVAVPIQIAEVGTLSPYVAWMIIAALVLVMIFLSLLLVIVVKKRMSK